MVRSTFKIPHKPCVKPSATNLEFQPQIYTHTPEFCAFDINLLYSQRKKIKTNLMNCFDDSCISHNKSFDFNDNIDYLSNEISIPNEVLIKCFKQSKYDISLIIPSTISLRLKNIAWRRLYKNLNNLKEISPRHINWYKDHDINWCYGPNYNDDDLIVPFTETHPANFAPSNQKDIYSINDESVDLFLDSELESELEVDLLKLIDDNSSTGSITSDSNNSSLNFHYKLYKKKKVKFNFIINSREIINGVSIDYDFLDNSMLVD